MQRILLGPVPPIECERREVLITLDIQKFKVWAAKWGVALTPASDASLLRSLHIARAGDDTMPPDLREASRRYLAEHRPPVPVLYLPGRKVRTA